MLKIFCNYKYNNKYDYIKLFANRNEQTNYFNALTHFTIDTDETYIKDGESFIIERNHDLLVDIGANYLMYNNGRKNIYAFIVDKEYIDEENTRIVYEIDVLNTFLFDFVIKSSFVERKVCSLSEIGDYDEGLEMGEHFIESEVCTLEKEYKWFAMFNGIKQQQLIFSDSGALTNVIQMPSPTFKPSTIIDDIQYPIHFMELREEYEDPIYEDIDGGNNFYPPAVDGPFNEYKLSSEGFRFIKGYEGYAPRVYKDSVGVSTICYGVTYHGEPDYYNELLTMQPVPEEEGAKLSYNLKNERYANKIGARCKELGITKQYQFDALVSFSYNLGNGIILGDNELTKAIKNNPLDETTIRPLWEQYSYAGGQQLNGLLQRRKQECNMFFGKNYEVRKITLINSEGNYDGYVTENNGNGWLPAT